MKGSRCDAVTAGNGRCFEMDIRKQSQAVSRKAGQLNHSSRQGKTAREIDRERKRAGKPSVDEAARQHIEDLMF